MPKIRKTSEQEKALQTIITDLKLVDRLNAVIENVEILESGNVTVQADSAKVVITLPASTVNKLLGDIRKENITEIRTLSRKYTITLDDEDEKILAVGTKKVAKASAEPAPVKVEAEVAEDEIVEATEVDEAETDDDTPAYFNT